MRVCALDEAGIPACMALRQRALQEHPLAFGSDPEHDRLRDPQALLNTLTDPHHTVLVAWLDGVMVGMLGVRRMDRLKTMHRAGVWGVYVTPEARGQGAGEALIAAAITEAEGWAGVVQLELSVSVEAEAARRLYERAGFVAWGCEPRALCWQGRTADELHMTRSFDR